MGLSNFIIETWPLLLPGVALVGGWFIDAIAEHLEAIDNGDIRFLLITMPPRMGKSVICSAIWPAFSWTVDPAKRWLTTSYVKDLATRDAVESRRLIESPWYQARYGHLFQMTSDQNVKTWYQNDHAGYRISSSQDSAVTGLGGDILTVDDPHNARDIQSAYQRQVTKDWWNVAMASRMNEPSKSAMVVVQQRLHPDDLAGNLLATGMYTHLSLPMEYEPKRQQTVNVAYDNAKRAGVPDRPRWEPTVTDPRTTEGEKLAPDRFGDAEAALQKQRMGMAAWNAQYQQRPTKDDGGIVKRSWWRYWTLPGLPLPPVTILLGDGTAIERAVIELPLKFNEQIQSWDASFTDATSSSYVVGQVWARLGASAFLLHQWRDQADIVKTMDAIRTMSAAYPNARAKLIEHKANGPAIIQMLQKELDGLIPTNSRDGKPARLRAVAPSIESGNVYVPHPWLYPWVNAFLTELADFPDSPNNDQVDSCSQGVWRLLGPLTSNPAMPGGATKSPNAALEARIG